MDGLAYLHLAETWETPAPQTRSPNSTQHLNLAFAPLLFFTIALTILNLVNPALAIKKGDSGPEVTELQKTLQDAGYFSRKPTGFYGSITQTAVKKFQTDNNLKVDGIVGPQTLSALQLQPEGAIADSEPVEKTPSKLDRPSPPPTATDNPNQLEDTTKNQPQKPFFHKPFLPPFKTETSDQNFEEKASELPSEKLVNSPENLRGKMTLKKTIYGNISPKSIVYSGAGLFFAQNMMYSHTITVYDRNFKLVKTIPDTINLSKFGFTKFKGNYRGSPVEAAFSTDGKYAYVSNYQMYGKGFDNPGSDRCSPSAKHDQSFLYRINTETLKIENAIPVGAVPKFNAVSPDNRFALASNWCSWDLSVVDINKNIEVERVKLGAYPRGIVVTPDSKNAYIAVMGSSDIAKVNLRDFSVEWLRNIGNAPRHLTIDPNGKYLYATLNGEGNVAKIDLKTGKVVDKVSTGKAPRSMTISDSGKLIYVVNYFSNTVSKVRTSDMKVLQTVNVNSSPIGITYDPETNQVWVACYSGSIMVFQD
ncbi:peptidoglycan-binding protein [Microcoleus sp. LEGE 07076]|uniref:peptidoglycan-binding protein n=1 Tax=Microcoleus sp. LEGE 07076 TaxID=915322 RepID=UPI00188199F2|nr:peptidoglycan-binding protein [Microcoleus sp. LEGE 07076]MBE9188199.1 peptidoglycan-binding protein [Microcoleus sp. LEGE 07076]